MTRQPFYGELLIEDYSSGLGLPQRQMLYVQVWEDIDGQLHVELHNNHPNGINTLIGRYGYDWTLRKVKWSLFVTLYELTVSLETPPVKARCVTGHKFGRMLEKAIKAVEVENRDIQAKYQDEKPSPEPEKRENEQHVSSRTDAFTIVHVDDEQWLLDMVRTVIQKNKAYTNVAIKSFQNRNDALEELRKSEADLLITDLRNDNAPGRKEDFGISGFEMLSDLAQRRVRYPILIFSGSLSESGVAAFLRKIAESGLNFSVLQKPAKLEQLSVELSKYLIAKALTKEQRAYFYDVVNRAGEPNPALQSEIDEITAVKTEDELKRVFSKTSDVERPIVEAELISMYLLAKQAELNPSLNAKTIEERDSTI